MSDPDRDRNYQALREQIEGLLSEGRLHSRRAGEWEKVETYWHIGAALLQHLGPQPRATYGRQVVVNLSSDLGLAQDLLWDLVRFRRSLPILVTYRELGWSHVRGVLSLPSQDQRRYYLQRANRERWTVRQLRDALAADAFGRKTTAPYAVPPDADPQAGTPLRARFGELHTYRVAGAGVAGAGVAGRSPRIDLGFRVTWELPLPGVTDPQPDGIVTARRSPDGAYRFATRPARTGLYTCTAAIERIVDGDTLIAEIDIGFGHRTRQRLRLRGIDCPELCTAAGRNARAFVVARLAAVNFVVVTTHHSDTYGRYLADLPTWRESRTRKSCALGGST